MISRNLIDIGGSSWDSQVEMSNLSQFDLNLLIDMIAHFWYFMKMKVEILEYKITGCSVNILILTLIGMVAICVNVRSHFLLAGECVAASSAIMFTWVPVPVLGAYGIMFPRFCWKTESWLPSEKL